MLAVALNDNYTDRFYGKQDCRGCVRAHREIEDRMRISCKSDGKTQSTVPAPAITPTRTVTTPARSGKEMAQDWTEDDAALDVAD